MYEARQNKERVSRIFFSISNRSSFSKYKKGRENILHGNLLNDRPLQRLGEEGSLNKVKTIKRGNVLRDIEETKGISAEASFLFQKKYPNLLNGFYDWLVNEKIVDDAHVVEFVEPFEPMIHSEAIKAFGFGNCLDFSQVIFSELLKLNTKEFIYRCSLDNQDHAFVITYPLDVDNVSKMNLELAKVVDAWFDKDTVYTLKKYCEINIPGVIEVDINKILIERKEQSTGKPISDIGIDIQTIQTIITKHIADLNKSINPDHVESRYQRICSDPLKEKVYVF